MLYPFASYSFYPGTDLVKVNKCVQNYINHTGKFPDFIDIQELIKKVNSEENLNLNDDKVQEIGKRCFDCLSFP